jgi:TolB protein
VLYDAFGHTPIPGLRAFVDSAHLAVRFEPLSPLAAAREYELVVTSVGRDLNGDSAEELRVRFTTASKAAPEALLSGRLAFQTWAYDESVIFTMRPDGSDLRRLTEGFDPQWSPDGTRLAFWRIDADGAFTVHVIDADGTGERSLVRGYDPTWSPDGQHIAFGCGGICVMNADGSDVMAVTAHELNTVQGQTCIEDTHPRWSPDGSTIAFMRFPPPWPRYGPNGPQCLTKAVIMAFAGDFLPRTLLIAPDGSDERPLPASLSGIYGSPAWSPDGTFIAGYTFGAVVVARSDGTGTATFAYVSETPGAMTAPVWSPDGTRLMVGEGPKMVFATPTGSDVYTTNPPHPWGLHWNGPWSWSGN